MMEPEKAGRLRLHLAIVGIVVVVAGLVLWWLLRPPSLEGETVFDAGEVTIATPEHLVRHEFVLKNITDGTLSIVASRATCGCTEYLEPDADIGPGEEVVVPVTLSLQNTERKQGGVVLQLDDGSTVNLVMKATGTRVRPLVIIPRPIDLLKPGMPAFMNLEWAPGGRPPRPTLTATNGLEAQAGDWKLKAKAESKSGRPALWTAKLILVKPDTPGLGTLTAQVGDAPPSSVDVIWTRLPSSESPEASGPGDPEASP